MQVLADSDELVDARVGMEQWPAIKLQMPLASGVVEPENGVLVRWDANAQVTFVATFQLCDLRQQCCSLGQRKGSKHCHPSLKRC